MKMEESTTSSPTDIMNPSLTVLMKLQRNFLCCTMILVSFISVQLFIFKVFIMIACLFQNTS